jgi:hypothetical protein
MLCWAVGLLSKHALLDAVYYSKDKDKTTSFFTGENPAVKRKLIQADSYSSSAALGSHTGTTFVEF